MSGTGAVKKILQGLLILVCGLSMVAAYAQETAAVLEVSAEGVDVLRWGVTNWLSLSADAQTPIGSGDRIRTDAYGRVFIHFDETDAYVMPDTEIVIAEFSPDRLSVELAAGRVIFAFDALPALDFQLQVGNVVIEEPSLHFAVQVEENIVWVISTDGILSGTMNGEAFVASPGEGLRISDTLERVALAGDRISFASIDGLLDGCPAVVNGRGEVSLNVRVGPSVAYDVLGSVPDGLNVFLMATNPDDARYRIQFLNGFGWILSNAVIHNCDDLPVLPYSAGEHPIRIVRATSDELTFLRPYFGAPEDDLIFYILPQLDG